MKRDEKLAEKYARLFCRSMKSAGYEDTSFFDRYKSKYIEYTASESFREYSQYKTMSTDKVYAAIVHAKVCEENGISVKDALYVWETYSAKNIRRSIRALCRVSDLLPNGYKIVSGWLYKDAQERIAENCLTYEMLDYSDSKLEYNITRCAYADLFERYGIREFCKSFCNNDLCMSVMHRKARFIRHSDLIDGELCHDEIINRRMNNENGKRV